MMENNDLGLKMLFWECVIIGCVLHNGLRGGRELVDELVEWVRLVKKVKGEVLVAITWMDVEVEIVRDDLEAIMCQLMLLELDWCCHF